MRKIIFFIMLFSFSSSLLAETVLSTDVKQGNNYTCPKPVFTLAATNDTNSSSTTATAEEGESNTTAPPTKFFVCPKLDSNHISILTSVNGFSYQCSYYNQNSYSKDLTCSYVSTPVQTALNSAYNNLQNGDYVDVINNLKTQSTFLDNTALLNENNFTQMAKDYQTLYGIQNGTIGTSIPQAMDALLNKIETNVVTEAKKGADARHYTFAELIGKIITLNEHVITGIKKTDMSININSDWQDKMSTIGEWEDPKNWIEKGYIYISGVFKKFFTSSDDSSESEAKIVVPANNSNFKIASFTDMFKSPIWGYYYLLMSYFDYLVNKVAILLILVVGGYIGVLSLSKGFINSKLNPQGEFGGHTQSQKYSKVITSMSLIVFFLLSPATKQSVSPLPDSTTSTPATTSTDTTSTSTDTTSSESDKQTVFYTNDTIAKNVIRQIVDVGNYAGTLTNDLGLSAYLYYFTRKEGIVNNVNDYKMAFDGTIRNLLQLKYASAVMKDCKKEYNKTKLQDFFVELDNKSVTPSSYSDTKTYTTADNIDYPLCQTIAKELIQIPRNEAGNIEYTTKLLNNLTSTDEETSNKIKALGQVVSTMLLLNDKMGWVSVMMVPVTDKIMKVANFYSMLMPNQDTTAENAQQNINQFFAVNAHNSKEKAEEVSTEDFTIKEAFTQIMGNMSIYMVLPGFSDIYKVSKEFATYTLEGVGGLIKLIPIFRGSSWLLRKIIKIGTDSFMKLAGLIAGFIIAIYLWNISIQIIFSVIVSLLILFKIVFYFKDVLMYFVTSVFIPLLSFSRDVQHKVNKFLLDGLFLAVYPMIFVAMCYLFVFALELFQFLYDTIFQTFAYSEVNIVKTLASYHDGFMDNFKAFMIAESILTAGTVISILFELIIAYFMLFKGVGWVLSKLGFDDLAKNEQMSEQLIERGVKNVNPVV